jgi:hypothetical protein
MAITHPSSCCRRRVDGAPAAYGFGATRDDRGRAGEGVRAAREGYCTRSGSPTSTSISCRFYPDTKKRAREIDVNQANWLYR